MVKTTTFAIMHFTIKINVPGFLGHVCLQNLLNGDEFLYGILDA